MMDATKQVIIRPAAQASPATTAILDWLDQFAAAVRAVDFDAGRALFDADVVSFGTFARMVFGIDQLIDGQWKHLWGCTRSFQFSLNEAHVEVTGDLAWAALPWASQGRDAAGRWYDRAGRCTLVLRCRSERWLCVHSHFSRVPEPRISGNATPA